METPNYMWPYRVWRMINSRPLYEKYDVISRYTKTIETIDQQRFIVAARDQLVLAMSSRGKVAMHVARGSLAGTRSAAIETCARFLDAAVALLNRALLPGGYGVTNLWYIHQYEKIPEQYIRLSTIIWESVDVAEIKDAAARLLDNTLCFAQKCGVGMPSYVSVSEVPV